MEVGKYYEIVFEKKKRSVWCVHNQNNWVTFIQEKNLWQVESMCFYIKNTLVESVRDVTEKEKTKLEKKFQQEKMYRRYLNLIHPTLLFDFFGITTHYDGENENLSFAKGNETINLSLNPYNIKESEKVLALEASKELLPFFEPMQVDQVLGYLEVTYRDRLRNLF